MQVLMERLARYLVGRYMSGYHIKRKASGYKRARKKKVLSTAEIQDNGVSLSA
ncbi:MAG: hypothetical protein HY954_07575 [Deltaproteobacteria bacterium]|nr:hypothetical protein [Deltaproteobacteria bacterium]